VALQPAQAIHQQGLVGTVMRLPFTALRSTLGLIGGALALSFGIAAFVGDRVLPQRVMRTVRGGQNGRSMSQLLDEQLRYLLRSPQTSSSILCLSSGLCCSAGAVAVITGTGPDLDPTAQARLFIQQFKVRARARGCGLCIFSCIAQHHRPASALAAQPQST
jgi:hypothetical protein